MRRLKFCLHIGWSLLGHAGWGLFIAVVGMFCADVLLAAPDSVTVTNTELTVDQRGNLNAAGVASVEDVATNAAKAVAAQQRAENAQQTAVVVSNSIDTVAQNLMANNGVIYRSGFSDSFAPIVVFTESDKLVIAGARWTEQSAARLVCQIEYVCTADLGTTKPTVMHREVINGARSNFSELADSNVTAPVYHAESRTVGSDTFSGYYSIVATIPNPVSYASYFLWIKCEADAPSGQGGTLDLPNGVTGGRTYTATFGDKSLGFVGGVLMEVE